MIVRCLHIEALFSASRATQSISFRIAAAAPKRSSVSVEQFGVTLLLFFVSEIDKILGLFIHIKLDTLLRLLETCQGCIIRHDTTL